MLNKYKNVLLLFMLICYLLPIFYVYVYYDSNTSISNIICNEKLKYYILFFMWLMGIGTILYELERKDIYSQIFMYLLLIGIYVLIYVNENNIIHYVFAFLSFIVILFFMLRHCYLKDCNIILLSSLLLEFLILLYIVKNINKNIFYSEILYLLNFAFYYLYLHFIT